MSTDATAWAMKRKTGFPRDKLILMLMGDVADMNDDVFAGVEYLAEHAECQVRDVVISLDRMERKGLIRIGPEPDKHGGRAVHLLIMST